MAKTQNEESAARRYNPVNFPVPLTDCTTCHEKVWSDQGHVFVKGPNWDDDKDMFLETHHDDCWAKDIPEDAIYVKRTAKKRLEDA